jgi:hypothetical protein
MFARIFRLILAAWVLAFSVVASTPAHAAGGWRKVVVKYSQFEAASTTDTVVLYTTKKFETIERIVMRRDVDFAGGSLTTYTISVGKSGAVTKYQAAIDVFTGVSNGNTNSIVTTGPGVEPANTEIIATATGSHNLSTATAGQVTFFILVSEMPPGI